MSTIMARVKRAVRAFRASPGAIEVAASTVRPLELNQWYGRRQQYQYLDLVSMFLGTVKVAASRNAAGIASNQLRIFTPKRDTAFASRALSRAQTKALCARAGTLARKAMIGQDEAAEITDPKHPLFALLQSINPINNPYDTMEATVVGLGMTGNAYWKVVRFPDGTPMELWPLQPQFVHVVADKETIIGSYVYGRGTEVEQTFAREDIVHFKYVNPKGDPYYGLGDLAACVSEARLGFEFVAIAQAMLDNGGNPGWLVYGPMTPEQRTQLEVSMQVRTAGVKNAGRHVFLSVPESVKVARQDMGEKEIAFLSSADRVDAVVYKCFDIPVELTKEKPGGLSGNSLAMLEWQTYGLQPRGRKIEEAINAWIQREAAMGVKAYEGVFVAFDAWVQEDQEAKHPLVIDAYNAGLLRKNEARMAIGQDADPDPDANEYKAEPVAPAAGGFGQPGATDGTSNAGDNAAKSAAALRGRRAATLGAHPDPQSAPRRLGIAGAAVVAVSGLLWAPGRAHCCAYHRKDIGTNALTATETQLEAALRAWFDGIAPQVVASTDQNGLGIDLAANEAMRTGFDAATQRVLEAIYHAGLIAGVRDVAGKIDGPALQRALTERASAYLREYQGPLWSSVSRTLQDRVQNALADKISEGATIQDLKSVVREVMGNASDTAAETIARTEAARAYQSAKERAWLDSGAVESKEWLLSADPCELCVGLSEVFNAMQLSPMATFLKKGDSLVLPGWGEYSNDYADMNGANGHPNCRCTIGSVFKE